MAFIAGMKGGCCGRKTSAMALEAVLFDNELPALIGPRWSKIIDPSAVVGIGPVLVPEGRVICYSVDGGVVYMYMP